MNPVYIIHRPIQKYHAINQDHFAPKYKRLIHYTLAFSCLPEKSIAVS